MLVKNVMIRNPITVSPDMSVVEAKDVMVKNKINKLPVLDKNGALAGIITKNDLTKACPSEATTLDMYELGYLLSKLTVKKLMHKDVKTVTEEDTVEVAAKRMREHAIGCLPVMKDDVIVGIVTATDLFNTFIDMFNTDESGCRATIVLDEKPGQVSKLSKALADVNGNITSIVTCPQEDKSKRRVVVKVTGLNLEQYKKVLEESGAVIEDLRNV